LLRSNDTCNEASIICQALGDGTETAEDIKASLKLDPCMILIATANGTSRLHSSRRVFQELYEIGTKVPVIHHMARRHQ
jgi:hypothetical protein